MKKYYESNLKFKEPKIVFDDYKCPLEEIYIEGKGLYYTDKNGIIFTRARFLTGVIETLRTDIDDYVLISDKYVFLYYPIGKKSTPKELQNKIKAFWKRVDSYRGDGMDENALEEYKNILNEINEKDFADIDYLQEKGINVIKKEDLKWELIPLSTDLVTGNTAYTFRGFYENKNDKKKNMYLHLKMPYKLWKQVSKYFEMYKEPSDYFDPMGRVDIGTYYTFNKNEVEKIFKKYNKEIENV